MLQLGLRWVFLQVTDEPLHMDNVRVDMVRVLGVEILCILLVR